MKNHLPTRQVPCLFLLLIPVLFLLLGSSAVAQLSGTKYIGGATPDYATIELAITDLNTQGVVDPGVTFLIGSGTYSSANTLNITTTTGTATAPIIFKPDAGATVVVERTGTAGIVWQLAAGVKYLTIDGSNTVGGSTRDLTIINTVAGATYGLTALGNNPNCLFTNLIVDAGAGSTANRNSTSSIGIRVHYSGSESNETKIINNHVTNAGIGIRMEGNSLILNNVISNNVVDNVGLVGIYALYASNTIISHNEVQVPEGTGTTTYGIQLGSSIQGNFRVYDNIIHNIKSNSTSTSTTAGIAGIYSTSTSTGGTPPRAGAVFNNFIYDISYTAATGTAPVYGIWFSAASPNTSPDTIAYNSVSLTGTGDGVRNSAAIAFTSTTTGHKLFLKNNILSNQSLYSTGFAWAILKSGTAAQTTMTSDNNDLYAGTIGTTRFTGRIVSTDYASIADWRTASGGDNASFAELPPFTSATDLHIPNGTSTQLESGGVALANITEDFDGDIRNGSTPDIGADEFAGLPIDLTPPVISYTPLPNTTSLTARTLTADISDLSGVPTAGIGLPELYWKINSGTYTDVQGVYVSGNQYTFTFGDGVLTNDVVYYYVVAQDLAGTPNVGAYPSNGAGGFTSNPPAASVPPTNPSSYIIVDQPLSGDYTVGLTLFNRVIGKNLTIQKMTRKVVKEIPIQSSENKPTVKKGEELQADEMSIWGKAGIKTVKMEVTEEYNALMDGNQIYNGPLYVYFTPEESRMAGLDGTRGVYPTVLAAASDLNLRGVSGPVRFLLNDAEYDESAPIIINITSSNLPTSTNTVTFKPNTGVTSAITVASANPVFITYNSYITIDGSNTAGGTSRDLTLKNTGAGGVTFFSGGTDITIKNTIGFANTSTSPYGFIFSGITNGTAVNNLVYKASLAIQSQAASANIIISDNDLGSDVTADQLGRYGIVLIGTNGFTISNNTVFGIITSTSGPNYGILLGYNSTSGGGAVNGTVTGNIVHDIINTNTGGYGAYGITVSTGGAANDIISNNVIYRIVGTGDNIGTTSWIYNPFGIVVTNLSSGVNIYYNSINLYGEGPTYSAPTGSAGIIIDVNCSGINFIDNVIKNEMTGTGAYKAYGIYIKATVNPFIEINNNDYYVNSANPSFLGFFSTEDTTLAQWQADIGQDANSISSDPLYVANTDLRPAENTPLVSAGAPIAGITTDILGVTRNAATPTIGAYEEAVYMPLAAGVYTIGLSAFKQSTGKDVYFETRTHKVKVDLSKPDSYLDLNPPQDKNDKGIKTAKISNIVEVTRVSKVLMENGKPFNNDFYKSKDFTGDYPTITEAVNDLNLRGVSGAVTFLLVDTNYPNETYPIVVGDLTGVSSTNTVIFKPAPGVVTLIPGAVDQSTSTFQLGGADYVTIDGSNTAGGSSKDLTIEALNSSPAFHFFGASDNNVVMNTNFSSMNTSTGSGTFLFGSTNSGDFNIIENCDIKANDTSTARHANGIYMFSTNSSTGNQILNCNVTGFASYGIYLRGAPSHSHIVQGNTIDLQVPSSATTIAGIRLDGPEGTIVEGNYILNLNGTASSPSIYGIYYYGISGAMNIIIRNNVVSLGDMTSAGTMRGLDYYGYTPNSVEMYFNTVYIGGTDVTGGSSYGLTKRAGNDTYKIYDNNIFNTRSNGTGTGTHYGVYMSTTTATTFELNNNDYYTSGTGGALGYYGGSTYTTLADWQTATGQDANSLNADPQLVSATDLRPLNTSPLIGAGLTIAGITTDILGDLRNEPPTIGAYENGVVSVLAAPTGLTAEGDTNMVYLQWTDNSNNELGFVIERRLGDTTSVNPFEVIDTTLANEVYYFDTNVEPLTTYTYRLYAYNSESVSAYSNIAQATTPVPVELTSFIAKVGEKTVTINWSTATETNNSGFEVQRKIKDNWEKVTFIKGKGTTTEKSDYSYTDDFRYQSVSGIIVYRLKQVDFNGTFNYSNLLNVDVDFTPKEYTLYQNYPNPFNPATKIKFALPFDSRVKISVYNILGELVDVILDEVRTTGYHDIQFNGLNMSSGMYIYTIQAKSVDGKKDFNSVKKMMLVK